MRSKSINTLNYTGIVTLSQYIGKKQVRLAQIHNTGGNPLFDFLANCLIGDFTLANIIRPTKIMLVKYNDTFKRYEKFNGEFTPIRVPAEKIFDGSKSIVRYSFMLSADVLSGIIGTDELYLGLYPDNASSNEPENYAAICKLDEVVKSISVNTSLLVDWELIISNSNIDVTI